LVVSDLDEVMARFAGRAKRAQENASLKPDQQEWRKRNACKDAPCMDRVYRERLAELTAAARDQPAPPTGRPGGAAARGRFRARSRRHGPRDRFTSGQRHGAARLCDKQGAFVIREKSGHQTIVLLDIMRGGDNATQFPVMEQVHRGATITARGRPR
jgi:uncharacterized protein